MGIYIYVYLSVYIYIYIEYVSIYIYKYMECRWQLQYSGNIYLENHHGHITSGWWDGDHALGLSQYQPDDYWDTSLVGYPLLIKQGNRRSFLSFIKIISIDFPISIYFFIYKLFP